MNKIALLLFCLTIFLKPFCQVNLPNGLVAYFPFNGNANDASGNNIHGSVTNATLTADRFNSADNAYHFNGSNAYIQLPFSTLYDFAPQDSLSISVWLQPDQGNTTWLAQAAVVKSPPHPDYLQSNWNYGTYLMSYKAMSGYANNHVLNGTTTMSSTECWHNIISTYKNGVWKLYVNGVLEASDNSQTKFILKDGFSKIVMGKKGEAFGDFYKGKMDEVRIYNRVLTNDEIEALSQSPCRIVSPDFSIPDTVCVNEPVNIINNTQGATTHYWNFCVSNINQTPIGTNLGTFGGAFGVPVFMDYVQENGNYYGFLTNYAPGKLLRLDFGTSLLNIPTVTDLGNFGGTIPLYAEGIQVIKNEGKWYAIIVAGYPPASTPRVLKVEFGTNITNPSPVATSWGNIGNLLQPVDLHVFQEAGNWYGFTVNAENNTITRFNFTNSFDNTPTALNLGNVGNLSYPTGIYAIKDGVNWRVFITNAGNNTRTSGTFSLSRLDFGSSLLNTPTGVNLGNPGGLLRHPRDLTIMKFCDQIVGFAVNGFLNAPDMVRMDFNNDLTSVPTITSLGNNGNLGFPHSLSKIFRAGSDLYTFITNADNGSITRLQFAGCNNSSIPNFTGPNPPPITYSVPGTYNINLTVDDALTTQASICKQVVVLANPAITISNDTAICNNSSVQLFSSGGGSYTWTPTLTLNNAVIANPIASPLTNTTYYLTVTSPNNCSSFDSVKVNIISPAQFSVSPAQTICSNESVQLNASGGTIYSWTPFTGLDNSSIANPIANPLVSTNYTVTITETTCNESSSLTVPVSVLPLPTIRVVSSNDIDCTIDFVQLTASGAQDYSWSPAASLNNPNISSPIARPVLTTQYFVTGTDASGCINTDSIIVNVSANGKSGYLMPSAFTPNNDGLNDCFGIKYWGAILELEFNIFNRWGERVFHTTNPSACWNGKFRGVEQKSDVYVYWIKAKTTCDSSVFRKGVIMLIR